jgi:4-hydroxy-tetrahydrodipicolinate reductase
MRVVIVGASGRMGLALARAALEREGIAIVAAIDRPDSPRIGEDFGTLAGIAPLGIAVSGDLSAALTKADLMIDFSTPRATVAHLEACAKAGVAALVGTTGLTAEAEEAAERLAARIPVLIAANCSIGVTLLIELVQAAAKALPPEFDIEIFEMHHRHKQDAPSGTALALGRAAAAGRELGFEEAAVAARAPDQPRRRAEEIGFAVLRGGDLAGDHTVYFAGSGERLTLGHQASDRAIFARGALRAGSWLIAQPPGRYRMADVIGFKSVV